MDDKTSKEGNEAVFEENEPFGLIRRCAVEMIGDGIFIFIGSLASTHLLNIAIAHGVTIAVLIIAMGHISGGHFNPAVTLGVLVSGNIRPISAVCYIVAQLTGGLLGALLVRAVLPDALYETQKGGATTVNADIDWINALVCEMILTFILVNTVLCAAVDSEGSNVLAALGIGLSITVDILAGGPISGASMNPARSLGPAVGYTIFGSGDEGHWRFHYIYYVGPALGAILAGITYRFLLAKPEKRLKF